jgi:Fur family peroxide stress response transcriptional regulator
MKDRPQSRQTRQRRVVYESVKRSKSHPTADMIFEKVRKSLPNISLGTVYRNLSVLKEQGLLNELHGADRKTHYDANLTPHAHFTCTKCGAITDIMGCPEVDWHGLDELTGCSVESQRIEFCGVCSACTPYRN